LSDRAFGLEDLGQQRQSLSPARAIDEEIEDPVRGRGLRRDLHAPSVELAVRDDEVVQRALVLTVDEIDDRLCGPVPGEGQP
jgi:hypothetical protein